MLGLAKETVCRALMRLRKDGLINLGSGVLEIRDFDKLVQLVGDDSQGVFDECFDCAETPILKIAA